MNLNWSVEFPFTPEAIRHNAPTAPGIYEIMQSMEYPRYESKTRVLKIGKSDADVRQELLNHDQRHTAANRLARIRNREEISVTFRYVALSAAEAGAEEKRLLREFEDRHWDLPVLNSQRGYDRGEDRHYRDT
jgi:hypothetical protein